MSVTISGTNGILLPNGGDNLVWYEEGTWTPAVTCTTPGTLAITYTTQIGYFTRIGRQVTVTFNVAINTITVGTGTGEVFITGAPYPVASGMNFYGVVYTIGVDLPSTSPLTSFCGMNLTEPGIFIRNTIDNGGPTTSTIGGVAATDQILGTITYFTS